MIRQGSLKEMKISGNPMSENGWGIDFAERDLIAAAIIDGQSMTALFPKSVERKVTKRKSKKHLFSH
jgi:hypothetical protein